MRTTLSHDAYLALRRFPALDGARAFAAVSVVFFHFQGPARLQGWLGVQLFFVLSGFLITTLLLREEDAHGRISLRGFYLRRVFRILPVYFLLLGVVWAVYAVRGQVDSSGLGASLHYELTFFNEFQGATPYGQSWSLGVEQKFYLFWPLLAFVLIHRFRRAPWARLAVIGGLLGVGVGLMSVHAIAFRHLASGWPENYMSILVGCLVAALMHDRRTYRVLRPLTHPYVAVAVVLGFAVFQYEIEPLGHVLSRYFSAWGSTPVLLVPVYAVAVGLLLPALVAPGPVTRVLGAAPMRFVGERSYSLYLVQNLAALAVMGALPRLHGLPLAITMATASLLLADLIYRYVEVPFIELGRKAIKKRDVAPPSRALASGDLRLSRVGA
ncbi:acyltransferase family protein [Streptacidiphilus neutrinimicus]|uniref:acyltransferase family protein n=1 Tax=Streptacidiphilus neutrinimicus TaxID=105420 RepID=UPI0005A768FE|nr:acyltransferase [Streptacidiphilus neutrinimicus]